MATTLPNKQERHPPGFQARSVVKVGQKPGVQAPKAKSSPVGIKGGK